MNNKSEIAVVQYNYPEITIVSCSKTLTKNSFFKYEISGPVKGEAINQMVLDNVAYLPRHLYLFRESCVIENERLGPGSSEPLFFVIPLQSSWFVSKTALDPLFSGPGGTLAPFSLENMIANNQPCSVGGNRVVLSLPISVPFVFPQNMATMDAVFGKIGPDVRSGIASIFQPTIEGFLFDSKKKSQKNKYLITPELAESTGPGTTKCTASDPSGKDIAQIAMMPVDGDALTGIYTASMTRMINDFFLFICAVGFSYFFVTQAYVFLVINGVDSITPKDETVSTDSDNQKHNIFSLFNTALIISSVMLCFGLIYKANHGANGEVNTDELTIGILFFIIFGISLCLIIIQIAQKTPEYKFLTVESSVFDNVNLNYVTDPTPFDNVRRKFYGFFFGTMSICFIVLLCFLLIPNKKLNDLVLDWEHLAQILFTICLGSCGIFSVICTLTMTILENNKKYAFLDKIGKSGEAFGKNVTGIVEGLLESGKGFTEGVKTVRQNVNNSLKGLGDRVVAASNGLNK